MRLTHEQRQQKIAELRVKLHGEMDTAHFLETMLDKKEVVGPARVHYEQEQKKCAEKQIKIRMELERLRGVQ